METCIDLGYSQEDYLVIAAVLGSRSCLRERDQDVAPAPAEPHPFKGNAQCSPQRLKVGWRGWACSEPSRVHGY